MEHYRTNGKLAQGYFCSRCGAPGVNMMGTGHGPGKCEHNPKLVKQLSDANPQEGTKPRFIHNGE